MSAPDSEAIALAASVGISIDLARVLVVLQRRVDALGKEVATLRRSHAPGCGCGCAK